MVGPQGLPPRRAVRIGYFQVIGGASGDMLLGALLDVGLSLKALKAELAKVPLPPYELTARRARQGPLRGTRVTVKASEEGRAHHLPELKDLIARSGLSARVKERAGAVLECLAQAEGRVHRLPAEKAPLHQVGATDALVDILGTAIGLELLARARAPLRPTREEAEAEIATAEACIPF